MWYLGCVPDEIAVIKLFLWYIYIYIYIYIPANEKQLRETVTINCIKSTYQVDTMLVYPTVYIQVKICHSIIRELTINGYTQIAWTPILFRKTMRWPPYHLAEIKGKPYAFSRNVPSSNHNDAIKSHWEATRLVSIKLIESRQSFLSSTHSRLHPLINWTPTLEVLFPENMEKHSVKM